MLKACTAALIKGLERALRTPVGAAELIEKLENVAMFPAFAQLTKAADYTAVAGDNRKLIVLTAAVTITLPAPVAGFALRIAQAADANMAVTCTGKLIVDGNSAAGTVTYSTASHKKGSHILVEVVDSDGSGTLKYLVSNLGGTTMTIT